MLPDAGRGTDGRRDHGASARVLFNTAPPEDTPVSRQPVDAVAPITTLTSTAIGRTATTIWSSGQVDGRRGGPGSSTSRCTSPPMAATSGSGSANWPTPPARWSTTARRATATSSWRWPPTSPATANGRAGRHGRGRRLDASTWALPTGAGHHAAQLRHRARAEPRTVDQSAVLAGRRADSPTASTASRRRVRRGAAPVRGAGLRARHRTEPRRHRPDGDCRDTRRRHPGQRRPRRGTSCTASTATAARR